MIIKTDTRHKRVGLLSASFIVLIMGATICALWSDNFIWIDFPVHSVIESVGFFTGFFLALLLFLQMKAGKTKYYYTWIIAVLLAMDNLPGVVFLFYPASMERWKCIM